MTFLWSNMLWALLLVPALIGFYLWLLRRKKKFAVPYANLRIAKAAMTGASAWRRHVPPALLLTAIAAMLLALARPAAVISLPSQGETVMLAMDVSGSMRAKDVEPTRLAASQVAARAFIAEQPRTTKIGLVTFAGTAALVQSPTLIREDLLKAIDGFELQRGTAVGSGLLVSLKTIFPDVDFDLRLSDPRNLSGKSMPFDTGAPKKEPPAPVEPGSFSSAVIILLTDGQTTTGPDPLIAARMTADRGVRVFTVGVGTPKGEIIGSEGWSMRVRLDEEALKNIANITRGEYFLASTATDLKKIYQSMGSRLTFEKKETEVSGLFAGFAALLVILAAALSMWWFNRVA
jgi:Ca-activated chloride channel homolog